jgi:hypothetical protein
VRTPRLPGDGPAVDTHATRFAPAKQRPFVQQAIAFRNRVAEEPYVPCWMAEEGGDASGSGGKGEPLLGSPGQPGGHGWLDLAHWPLVDDASQAPVEFARRTVDGGAEVRSLEGLAIVALCPLGRRLALTFRAAVSHPEGQAPYWGYENRYAQLPALLPQPRHNSMGSARVTQVYSVRQVPRSLEAPARLALQLWAAGATTRRSEECGGEGIVEGSAKTRGVERSAKGGGGEAGSGWLPAYVAARLPSAPAPPLTPEWHTVEINNIYGSSCGSSFNSSYGSLLAHNDGDHASLSSRVHGRAALLSPTEVLTLAAHAEKQWTRAQANAKAEAEIGVSEGACFAEDEAGEEASLYPSTQGALVEWTPEATFVALPGLSSSGVAANRVVEVTVHCDGSLLLVEGNYVTRTCRRTSSTPNSDDPRAAMSNEAGTAARGGTMAATATGAVYGDARADGPCDRVVSPGGAVEERLLHVSVSPYIRIALDSTATSPDTPPARREYCLGPFVARAVSLRSQLRPTPRRSSSRSPPHSNTSYRQPPWGESPSPQRSAPRSGLSAAFADSAALSGRVGSSEAQSNNSSRDGAGSGVVCSEALAAGRLSLYADGTVTISRSNAHVLQTFLSNTHTMSRPSDGLTFHKAAGPPETFFFFNTAVLLWLFSHESRPGARRVCRPHARGLDAAAAPQVPRRAPPLPPRAAKRRRSALARRLPFRLEQRPQQRRPRQR